MIQIKEKKYATIYGINTKKKKTRHMNDFDRVVATVIKGRISIF